MKNILFNNQCRNILILTILTTIFINTYEQCPLNYQSNLVIGSLNVVMANNPAGLGRVNLQTTIINNNNQQQVIINNTSLQQSTTFNFTLDTPFSVNGQPHTVSTAITDFNSEYSQFLYLSIKPIIISNNVLTFGIITPWRYTTWNMIKFSFIAQGRADIETGIYQINTERLSTNQLSSSVSATTTYNAYDNTDKNIQLFFPFYTKFIDIPQVSTYLTGFSIATSNQINSQHVSPFQVGQHIISKNVTGFSLYIEVTSRTTIINLQIAYIAYDSRIASRVITQEYKYEEYTITNRINSTLRLVKQQHVFTQAHNTRVFYGLTGFILSIQGLSTQANSHVSFTTTINSDNVFTFESNNEIIYLDYSYVLLVDKGVCTFCDGFQYFDRQANMCVSDCKTKPDINNATCIVCLSGFVWNGTECMKICNAGRVWNQSQQSCICPVSTFWTASACVVCPFGQAFNQRLNQCQCPQSSYWNGLKCLTCKLTQIWNPYSLTCQCPSNSNWNGSICVLCSSGKIWNSLANSCQCSQITNWNGSSCISCQVGLLWNTNSNKCQCQQGYTWNGTLCLNSIPSCSGSQVYNKITNKCICVDGYKQLVNGTCTLISTCMQDTVYNGSSCVALCAVGFYYSNGSCLTYTKECPIGMKWSIYQCVYNLQSCPYSMTWNGNLCISYENNQLCNTQLGYYYWNGSTCLKIQQRCPYLLEWKNNSCLPISSQCPTGSYFNGYMCVSYSKCQNNMIWNSTLVKCVCIKGTFWNGLTCISCQFGMMYENSVDGCICPKGKYLNGTKCQLITSKSYCQSVLNTQWNGTHCLCFPGYSAANGKCICYGLQLSNWCNRCYQKPYSVYNNGNCICMDGYVQDANSKCAKNDSIISLPPITIITKNIQCNVGTYWDNQRKQCLHCADGCLSCINCYKCLQCGVGYSYNLQTQLCQQICGDGKRFKVQCDDGNNIQNDGCSMDCKIQSGYTCNGGSPNSKDICTRYIPSQISLIQTGQSHLYGKIMLNIRVNYLPSILTSLINTQCGGDNCLSILFGQITSGGDSASISSKYLYGAYQSFSMEIDFKKQPISEFIIEVYINPHLKQKYFKEINISGRLKVKVSPMFLSLAEQKDYIR